MLTNCEVEALDSAASPRVPTESLDDICVSELTTPCRSCMGKILSAGTSAIALPHCHSAWMHSSNQVFYHCKPLLCRSLSGLGVFCFKGKETSFLGSGGYVLLCQPVGDTHMGNECDTFFETNVSIKRLNCRDVTQQHGL